jgi:UDP-N-acetylglucosamine acyltransferase
MSFIHPSASIHPDTVVHPNCYIGENVVIGANCSIGPNALIIKDTILGENNVIHPSAVIGGDSQHKSYSGEQTKLIIGDNNVIRECVTINRGDPVGGSVTKIGDSNLFMAYSHVAHDCVVGNNVVFVNYAGIAGHVVVEDNVMIGAHLVVTQHCRVGAYAFLTKSAFVTKDVLPFCNVDGQTSRIKGINIVGLKRNGFTSEDITEVKKTYRHLFLNAPLPDMSNQHVKYMMNFSKQSKRGLLTPKSSPQSEVLESQPLDQ